MNLEKDKSYSISYATKSGETKSIELTPEQDMNTPKLINYIKNQDNEFFKLLDDKTECLNTNKKLNQLEESNMDNEMLRGKDILYVLEDYTQEIGEDTDLNKFLQYVNKAQKLNIDTSKVTDWVSDDPAEKIALAYQNLDEKTAMNLIKECYGEEFFDGFEEFLDEELESLDTNEIHYIDESKATSLRESKYNFNSMEFEESIPHNMRFKEYDVLENSFNLFWVTQQPFDMDDLKQFQKALINDTPFAKAYVTVRDFSTYDPNEVNSKDIFAIVTFDKIDATGYMKACEESGWLNDNEKDPSTWVIDNKVTTEQDTDSNETSLTEAEDKDTDTEISIDFEDVDTYGDEDIDNTNIDTENQEEISNNIETATEEVVNEATDTDVLAVEVSNNSIDVLLADEQSAIDGYNAFLAQCKNTLLPALYNVLETEIKEIIADEEEHITKLNTIKSAFHLDSTPIEESKSIKTESIDSNYFEDIDTLEDLKDRIDELYDEEEIDDDQYDDIIDYLDERIDKVENYIEARSKVTNTDDRDIAGIMEDNTLAAIETIEKMLNKDLDENKEIKSESADDLYTEFNADEFNTYLDQNLKDNLSLGIPNNNKYSFEVNINDKETSDSYKSMTVAKLEYNKETKKIKVTFFRKTKSDERRNGWDDVQKVNEETFTNIDEAIQAINNYEYDFKN